MARTLVRAFIGPGKSAVPVRLPKGVKSISTPAVRNALEDMAARQRLSTGTGCVVAMFKKKGGGYVAAQRCANRTLKAHNKKQCRAKAAKGTKRYKRFVKC